MYCDNCGTENRENANFCYKCSQDLSHINEIPEAVVSAKTATPPPEIDESTTEEQFSRILGGRYELKDLLGRGGMGVVYRAYDQQLKMDVAIKFLLDRFVNDFSAVNSMKHEAKAAMQLAHPNIVRLFNFEDTPEVKYLLMEFIEGESLSSIAARKKERKFNEIEVKKYMAQVCEALKYAHSRSIVHRDIKPSNIIVTPTDDVKIADFGVAHIAEVTGAQMTGGGTPIYMSPEQIIGQEMDGRSDVYSMGVTMYEMLNGAPPFCKDDVSHQHLHSSPKQISGVSDWMNAVVMKCLRKQPDGRWSSAEELKDVLTHKKDIGVALKGTYQPWWARSDTQLAAISPKKPAPQTPPKKETKKEEENSEPLEVKRSPRPSRSSGVRMHVRTLDTHRPMVARAPEREQARIGYGILAGVIAGIIMSAITGMATWDVPNGIMFQLSWTIYGAILGASIGVAKKRAAKGLLSMAFGMLGGMSVVLMLKLIAGLPPMQNLASSYYIILCPAIVGAFIGVADGLYEKSIGYSASCLIWGTVGGGMAGTIFVLACHLLKAFWWEPINWLLMGVLLGLFANMCVGFATKPWTRQDRF